MKKEGDRMSIPTLTKEEIFTIKEINTIMTERKFTLESQLDSEVDLLSGMAIGKAKSFILGTLWDKVQDDQWKDLIKCYCKWQILSQIYSTVHQQISEGFKQDFYETTRAINTNLTMQVQEKVIPNYAKNIRFSNKATRG